MSLKNGIVRLTNRISKFSCCLYTVRIFCIRSESVLKRLLFFANCFNVYCYNTLDKGAQPAAFSKYLCGRAHIIQSFSYAHYFKLNEFKPY